MSTNSPFSTFLTSLAGTTGSASLSMKGPSPSNCSLPSACGWSGTCGVGLSPTAATVVPSPVNDGSPRSRTEDSSGSLPSRNATGREKKASDISHLGMSLSPLVLPWSVSHLPGTPVDSASLPFDAILGCLTAPRSLTFPWGVSQPPDIPLGVSHSSQALRVSHSPLLTCGLHCLLGTLSAPTSA